MVRYIYIVWMEIVFRVSVGSEMRKCVCSYCVWGGYCYVYFGYCTVYPVCLIFWKLKLFFSISWDSKLILESRLFFQLLKELLLININKFLPDLGSLKAVTPTCGVFLFIHWRSQQIFSMLPNDSNFITYLVHCTSVSFLISNTNLNYIQLYNL